MHSCEEFLLALRIGNMHQKEHGTLGEASATELGIEIRRHGRPPAEPER